MTTQQSELAHTAAGSRLPAARTTARQRNRRRVQIATGAALAAILLAWLIGYLRGGVDVGPLVSQVLPGAARVEHRSSVYFGYAADGELVGYAGTGEATGYAGPLEMLVGVDPAGAVIGTMVVEHRETPGFFRLLTRDDFFSQLIGLDYRSPMRLGEDLDAASGATISSEAVARAVREQVRALGSDPIGATIPAASEPIQFGAPEVLLIGLYAAGYVGHRSHHPQTKKWIRRATLLVGAIGLGFLYNKPLTIANFVSLLSGFWPDWRVNLYWYLLLGGILFVTTAQAKNPYCSWFCPFGAVQEGLAKVSGAKLYRPRRWHQLLQWLQRGLALGAVVLGLAMRQPGPVSFEPFGTLFELNGTTAQWVLLALVLLASLVVYRPFCNYLCPISPVVDYVGEGRRWATSLVRRIRR